jgi:hypothetical protein
VTSKNSSPSEGDDLGILDETASLDTTALGILGQTSQVSVTLPAGAGDDDDDLVEDVVDGEFSGEILVGELETAQGDDDEDATEPDAADSAADAVEVAEEAVSADAEPVEDDAPVEAPAPVAAAPAPAATPAPAPEMALVSKRFGEQAGQSSRETADLLTADRLLNPSQLTKPEPEGTWSHLLYTPASRTRSAVERVSSPCSRARAASARPP